MSALRSLTARLFVDRRGALVAAGLETLQSLSYLPFSAGVAWLVDHVLVTTKPGDLRAALPRIAGYVAANVALFVAHAWLTVHAYAASQKVTRATSARLRGDVVDRLFALHLSYVERRGAGALGQQLTADVDRVETFIALATTRLVPAVTLGGAALVYLAVQEPRLALLTLVAVPLSLALTLRARGRLETLATRVRSAGESFGATIVETAMGLRHLRSLGADAARREMIQGEIDALRSTGLEAGIAMTRAAMAVQMVHDLLPVVVWAVGGAFYLLGWTSLGALVAFVALLVFVQGGLAAITEAHRGWAAARPSWEALEKLLRDDAEDEDASHGDVAIDGGVELDAVVLRHDARRPALDGLTLSIAPGERVALMGTSGSGKSSLLDAIAGLVPPTEGAVTWSGRSRAEIGRAGLRDAIAVAPQEAFLFRTTLRENVRMGRPDASDADVEAACARAGLEALLARLPDGLDTAVDERGQNLSGGERQRLALARMFLRDPRVVLLDEPTSALDAETERALLPELEALFAGRTSIVATHRPALARRADRVVVLEAGRVVADGPPDLVAASRAGLFED